LDFCQDGWRRQLTQVLIPWRKLMTITQTFQRQVSKVFHLREHYPTVVPRLLTYRTQAKE
jgi:hypothetical protein